MLAQSDIITLGSDPKTWLVVISGVLTTMIVGRFIQSFKSGEGLVGAAKAVVFGTNTPLPPQDNQPKQ